jgi:hypothetical protein
MYYVYPEPNIGEAGDKNIATTKNQRQTQETRTSPLQRIKRRAQETRRTRQVLWCKVLPLETSKEVLFPKTTETAV